MELFKVELDKAISPEDAMATYSDMIEAGVADLPYLPCGIDDPKFGCIIVMEKLSPPPFEDMHFQLMLRKTAETVSFADYLKVCNLDASERGWMSPETELREMIGMAGVMLVAALATRGIVKDAKPNKRAKLGIGSKAMRRFTTITSLRCPVYSSGGTGTGTSKRAHWRRGHVKTVPVGVGRIGRKKVWIAPTFVNGDGEYFEREHYEFRT